MRPPGLGPPRRCDKAGCDGYEVGRTLRCERHPRSFNRSLWYEEVALGEGVRMWLAQAGEVMDQAHRIGVDVDEVRAVLLLEGLDAARRFLSEETGQPPAM